MFEVRKAGESGIKMKEQSTLNILEQDIRSRLQQQKKFDQCNFHWMDLEHLDDVETFIEIVDDLRKYNRELLEENISLKQQMSLEKVEMTDRLSESLERLKRSS